MPATLFRSQYVGLDIAIGVVTAPVGAPLPATVDRLVGPLAWSTWTPTRRPSTVSSRACACSRVTRAGARGQDSEGELEEGPERAPAGRGRRRGHRRPVDPVATRAAPAGR